MVWHSVTRYLNLSGVGQVCPLPGKKGEHLCHTSQNCKLLRLKCVSSTGNCISVSKCCRAHPELEAVFHDKLTNHKDIISLIGSESFFPSGSIDKGFWNALRLCPHIL